MLTKTDLPQKPPGRLPPGVPPIGRLARQLACGVVAFFWLIASSLGAPYSPFALNASLSMSNQVAWVTFDFRVPPDHLLYAEHLAFLAEDGTPLKPNSIPAPDLHLDAVSGQQKEVYDKPFSAVLRIETRLPTSLLVKFQGCSNSACYFPEKHAFSITPEGTIEPSDKPADTDLPIAAGALSNGISTNGFKLMGKQTGYVPKTAFLDFLSKAQKGEGVAPDALERFKQLGPLVSLLLIVLGGLGLNLTPCVLPLIPINLAIIGAGARASSRGRGFALGGTYGLGMALVYGILGLVVVLSGSKFGTLNSSAWFNLSIAAVFLVMALAMFDRINVDFSRFQGRLGGGGAGQKGPFVLALSMGAMAALLAGACVAPVVISVLLLAAHFYSNGQMAGLLLPFLLGLGMALPWPFAGAGLSFLPKPGKWMKWVKYSFGVLILLFAAYYGHEGYTVFRHDSGTRVAAQAGPSGTSSDTALSPESALKAALRQSREQGKPILIDFAASWCKNCLAMDSTVFPSSEVKERLRGFVVVRYDAEKPNESPARETLNQFGVIGLPTYLVLAPEK